MQEDKRNTGFRRYTPCDHERCSLYSGAVNCRKLEIGYSELSDFGTDFAVLAGYHFTSYFFFFFVQFTDLSIVAYNYTLKIIYRKAPDISAFCCAWFKKLLCFYKVYQMN